MREWACVHASLHGSVTHTHAHGYGDLQRLVSVVLRARCFCEKKAAIRVLCLCKAMLDRWCEDAYIARIKAHVHCVFPRGVHGKCSDDPLLVCLLRGARDCLAKHPEEERS